MNSVQGYRSQLMARQNTYLKGCFVLSITGHVILAAIAAYWFEKPSSDLESSDREPISFIVIEAPETKPPPETQQQAKINSADGGQHIPELPTNAVQSSRATLLPRNTAEPSPTSSSSEQSTEIGGALETNQPPGQASQIPLSQPQASPPPVANSISRSDHSPTPQIPSRSPATTPPLASSSAPPTSSNPTPPAASRFSSRYSTSAADLLPGNDSQTLVAQRNNQLFNSEQTATLPGVDAVRNDLWGPYLARLRQSIVGRWGQIQIDQTRQTRVQFTINRQGVLVGSVRVTQSSGFSSADNAALRAVQSAAPFGPFPSGTDKPALTVSFTFNYTLR